MNDFYSRCCDCGCHFATLPGTNPEQLNCPKCGLTTSVGELEMLAAELKRDQSCPITRIEVEQEIRRLFSLNPAKMCARQ